MERSLLAEATQVASISQWKLDALQEVTGIYSEFFPRCARLAEMLL